MHRQGRKRGLGDSLSSLDPASEDSRLDGAAGTLSGGRYMDAGEVAALVGLNRETVLRAWRSGHLPGYAANRKVVRFTHADVGEWMCGGRRQRRAPRPEDLLRPTPRSRPRRRAA